MGLSLSKTAQSYARLFAQGRVDAAALARAVQRGLILQKECDFILTQHESGADTDKEAAV